jgi:hypothetical protein
MSKSQLVLDKFSVGISAVCTVHCLAMPLIVGFMPALASMGFTHEHFHEALLYLILPTSSIALYLGCKKHKSKRVAALGIAGIAMLLLAHEFGHGSESLEKFITMAGSVLMAMSHLINQRKCTDKCHHS